MRTKQSVEERDWRMKITFKKQTDKKQKGKEEKNHRKRLE